MSYKSTTITATGAQAALSKQPNENQVLVTLSGVAYSGITFTFEATADGTYWSQVGLIDNKTGLFVAGGTAISPTDDSEQSWTWPLGQSFTGLRLNVSAYTSGTGLLKYFGSSSPGLPLFNSIAGSAGTWTNGTFSGTLGVTGATTLSSTLAVTGAATLSSTIAVTGAATFSSTVATGALTVTGAVTISTTLAVTGATTLTGAVSAASSVKSSHATAGIGYSTGAGGTVTQSTDKTTGVTLSKVCGAITLNNAALAAATIVSFTLTNTAIAATDVLVLNHVSGGTLGSYTLNAACAAGTAVIYVRNNTAGSLSEAIVIEFALIKGVTS